MPNVDRHTPPDRETPSDRHGQAGQLSKANLAVGSVIGQSFRVEEKLGSGGMGTVYRCTDLLVGRQVAVKLLQIHGHPDAKQLQRFRQEAAAIGRLKHSNIVSVHQMSISNDVPFIVMECINGLSLAQVLRRQGCLDPESAIRLMVQVADALEHAHLSGIVHRDLKPSNIMLVNGAIEEVKILDFGIAKTMESESTGDQQLLLTQTGDIVGTPMYMSPEQVLSRTIDGRSDQYSFGCVLYECLTGAPPFVADSAFAVMTMQTSEKPLPLSQASMGQKFTPELVACVERMLRKSPEERFSTMAEVKSALSGGSSATSMPKTHVPPKWKSRTVLSLAIGITVLLVGVCGYKMFGNLKGAQPHAVASQPHLSVSQNMKSQPIDILGGDPFQRKYDEEVTENFIAYLKSRQNSNTVTAGQGEWWAELKNKDLEYLHMVPRLDILILNKAHEISDEGMHVVQNQASSYKLPLHWICIGNTMVGGKGLQYVGRIPSIEHIELMHLRIQNQDLSYLKDLRLQSIDMTECPLLTGAVIEQIPRWKNTLNDVDLDSIDCQGHCEPLKQCGELSTISLSNSNLNVSDIQVLSHVPKLHTIRLGHNPLLNSGEGARMILSMPNLTAVTADAALQILIGHERSIMLSSKKLSPQQSSRIENMTITRMSD